MSQMLDKMLKSFDPKYAIKITDLDNGKDSIALLAICMSAINRIHNTFIDKENNVLYVGKLIK